MTKLLPALLAVFLLLGAGNAEALIAPEGDITGLSPVFNWTVFPGYTSYRFELWVDPSSWRLVHRIDPTTNDTAAAPAPLECGLKYVWKLWGLSGASSTLLYRKEFTPYAFPQVEKTAPTGYMVTSLNPIYSWSPVSGAAAYRIAVRDLTSGYALLDDSFVHAPETSVILHKWLEPGHRYKYYIRAYSDTPAGGYGGAFSSWGEGYGLEPGVALSPATQVYPDTCSDTLTPLYYWKYNDPARSFRLSVRQDTPQGKLVLDLKELNGNMVNVPSSYYTSPLSQGKKYYWYVRADNTAWSEESSFYAYSLSRPSPSGFPSGSIATYRPSFSWTPVSGAARYRVVARDLDNNLLVDAALDSGLTFYLPEVYFENGKTYKWFVKALGPGNPAALESGWSYGNWFYPSIPEIKPVGLFPSGVHYADTLSFSWSPVAGAAYYHIRIKAGLPSGSVIYESGTLQLSADTPLSYTDTPEAGGKYYWQVRADNSGWSDLTEFTLYSIPAPETNIGLNDGETSPLSDSSYITINTLRPYWEWSTVSGALSYRFSLQDGAGQLLADTTGDSLFLSYHLPFWLTPGKKYSWSVCSFTGGSGTGETSWIYTKIIITPEGLILRGVAPKVYSDTLFPLFTWEQLTDSRTYTLQVKSADFADSLIFYEDNLKVNYFRCPCALPAGKRYYWQVKADNSYWSFPELFTAYPILPPEPLTPSGFNTPLSPAFIWKGSAGAQSYTLYVKKKADGVLQHTIINITDTSSGLSAKLDPYTEYIWYVRAWTGDSNTGHYSRSLVPGLSFTTGYEPYGSAQAESESVSQSGETLPGTGIFSFTVEDSVAGSFGSIAVSFTLYPNPLSSGDPLKAKILLQQAPDEARLEIYSIDGELVLNEELTAMLPSSGAADISIPGAALSSGVYIYYFRARYASEDFKASGKLAVIR